MAAALNQFALPAVLVLSLFFIGWYIAGNEVMRRRGRALAVWCKRALDPLGGRQAIQWITAHSFRLEVQGMKSPFTSGSLTGLVESWDVPMIWFGNRLAGRRDMVLLQATLRRQPIWGLELYRRRSVLGNDARRAGAEESWSDRPLEEFRLASPGEALEGLARQLLDDLGPNRAHLIRLGLRRRAPNLTLGLNVPDRDRLTPVDFSQLLERLARTTLRYASPTPAPQSEAT